ncbi:MAG: hypothetical protein PUD71_10575, partial [Lachnospiraceae bacterium]|nr:hypothetical protein [Lachnospiraceae bacterium]
MRKKLLKKVASVTLAALMTLSTPLSDWSNLTAYAKTNVVETSTALELATSSDNQYGLADNVADGVILHAWNWSFSQIMAELPNIAEAGYTAIQTSPIQRN